MVLPTKMLLTFWSAQEYSLHLGQKKKKIFQSFKSHLGSKIAKPGKYVALNKAVKK